MGIRSTWKKLASIHPVWGLNAIVALLAAVLYIVWVRDFEAIQSKEIAWPILAVLILAAERWPVQLEFRRSSHSFSLSDIPLSLALVFATGTHALVGIVFGTAVALL